MERLDRFLERAGRGDDQLGRLADVAQIQLAHEAAVGLRNALLAQRRIAFARERVEQLAGALPRLVVGRRDQRAHRDLSDVRRQQPVRGEHARRAGHDDPPDADVGRDRAGVQRPPAAEGQQREVARIVPALDRDDAQYLGHLGVDQRDDPGRGALDVPTQRPAHRRDGRASAVLVDRKRPVEQRARVEPAQHDVRVGDGGPVAVAVTGRAGSAAGRDRPDTQRPRRVVPGDGPAAGADLSEVDEGEAHRVAAALDGAPAVRRTGRLERGADLRHAAEDRAGLGRRPAHVEREHVLQPERAPEIRRADDPAGRTAFDQRRRPPRGGLEHRHAAV